MAIGDRYGNRCDKALRVHFRQVNVTHFNVFDAVNRAQRIFGKYGIVVQIGSVLALRLSSKDLSRFVTVVTSCEAGQESPDQKELYDRFGVVDLSSVTVFLVQIMRDAVKPPLLPSEGIDGCAAHEPGRPAVYLNAFSDGYVLAHELGHVLLEHAPYRLQEHSRDPRNALCDGELETMTAKSPVFSIKQLEWIRRSPLLLAC